MKPLSIKETCYILFWAVGCILALLFIPALPSEVTREYLWAFDHLRDIPLWARLILAVLSVSVVLPWLNQRIWSAWTALITFTARLHLHRSVGYALIGATCFLLFWILRARNYALGDSAHLIQALTFYVHTLGYHLTFDEPLELYAHSIAYRLLHNTFNGSVEEAYALISALCGVGFVLIMLALWRRRTPDLGRRTVALGLIFSMGTMQLFFGYVENYTIVATGVMLYILLSHLYLKGQCGIVWPALSLSLSFCLHVLAGWMFPSLLYLWLVRVRERTRPQNLLSFGSMALAVILPIAATIGYSAYIGVSPKYIQGTHLWRMKFIFLLDESFRYYQYPMCSLHHLTDILNELILTSLPGVMALAFVGLFHRREIHFTDPFLRFLILSAAFLQLFAISWNPDLGAYRDWDLYAIIGFGYALLGAYVLTQYVQNDRKVQHVGLIFIVLSLSFSGPWIIYNAQHTVPVQSGHEAAHLVLGNAQARQGRLDEAIRNYKEAIRINPDNALAHMNLGEAYRRKRNTQEALHHFEEYLRQAPNGTYATTVRERIRHLRRAWPEKQ